MCLAAHESEFRRWTSGNVKLLLPPRQSRGVSLILLVLEIAPQMVPVGGNKRKVTRVNYRDQGNQKET